MTYLSDEDCRGYGHMDEHERLAFSEDAVETLIRHHRAEALREAASALHGDACLGCDPDSPLSRSARWLNARADRIEEGEL